MTTTKGTQFAICKATDAPDIHAVYYTGLTEDEAHKRLAALPRYVSRAELKIISYRPDELKGGIIVKGSNGI